MACYEMLHRALDTDRIFEVQDINWCWALANRVMNIQVPQKAGYFLTFFSRRTLLHVVS
jgi:hypothetical protein